MNELVLPAFEMDCRDWLVATPADAGLPDELAGAPLLAVLSTVVLDDGSFVPASGVITVGLLDDELATLRPIRPGCVAAELTEGDEDEPAVGPAPGLRYLLPAPDQNLALLAEFTFSEGVTAGAARRVESLMASFRWRD
jgi:hypothetical protein